MRDVLSLISACASLDSPVFDRKHSNTSSLAADVLNPG